MYFMFPILQQTNNLKYIFLSISWVSEISPHCIVFQKWGKIKAREEGEVALKVVIKEVKTRAERRTRKEGRRKEEGPAL